MTPTPGQRYRPRSLSGVVYRVESVKDGNIVYTVCEGKRDGSMGKTSIREFMTRVHEQPLRKMAEEIAEAE